MRNVVRPYGHDFELVFEVEVGEGLSERDIYGAIYRESETVEPFDLSTLQRSGEAGKCLLEKRGDGKYILRIPMSTRPAKAAVLAAAIEGIGMVGGRPASFRLVQRRDGRVRMTEIALRAQEIVRDMEREEFFLEQLWSRMTGRRLGQGPEREDPGGIHARHR